MSLKLSLNFKILFFNEKEKKIMHPIIFPEITIKIIRKNKIIIFIALLSKKKPKEFLEERINLFFTRIRKLFLSF